MPLTSSDELVRCQPRMTKASSHSNSSTEKLLRPRIMQNTTNVHAFVSIGASSDEEELALPIKCKETCDCVAENRNDEESTHSNSREVEVIRTGGLTEDRGAKDSHTAGDLGNLMCVLHTATLKTSNQGHSKREKIEDEHNEHRAADCMCMLEIGVEIVNPENKYYIPIDELQNSTLAIKRMDPSTKFGSHTIQDNLCFDNESECTAEPSPEANISEQCLVAECPVENRMDDRNIFDTHPIDINMPYNKTICDKENKKKENCPKREKEEESKDPPRNGDHMSENIETSPTASGDKESLSTKYDNSKFQRPLTSILRTSPFSQSDVPRRPRLRFLQGPGRVVLSTNPKSFSCFHRKPVVTFSFIKIRTYPIILGDHPSCKFGAPISIGWDYHECQSIPVDIYESNRTERRRMKQLYLNSGCRRMILKGAGFSLEQISKAINDVQLIQMQRKESTNDEVGILPFFRGGKNRLSIEQVGGYMNMKGWNKNKTSRWSRVFEICPSGKLKSKTK
ncbi:hypothetical protein HJC23_007755 [Cyclotella cryptica]|uniref:Uncharacterized protein n=1 Tax=Cyclotella cryptica TaxID=29204 RepID=A0ABD3QZI0_9STRA|eukprot:CCRYP_000023-RA/>CCRYP_000023-RA protein AED:0.30 eAED:-0.67 QI:0/-1/0/1/-1/1/1/0/508